MHSEGVLSVNTELYTVFESAKFVHHKSKSNPELRAPSGPNICISSLLLLSGPITIVLELIVCRYEHS